MSPVNFNPPQKIWANIDWILIGTALALSIFGIVTIWGASANDGNPGAFVGYARRQAQWLILGVIVMSILFCAHYQWSKSLAVPLYIGLIVMLVAVLVFGSRIQGASSWFVLRLGARRFQFQPSELGKVIVVIMLARYLSSRMLTFRKLKDTFVPLALAALPMALIFRQPDLGTAMVFVPVIFVMFFVAGIRKRVLLFYVLVGVATAGYGYTLLKPYQKARIETFLNPGEDALGRGYNIIQAQTALGSGQVFGKGWGQGTQTSFRFLPEYQTDFVFPTLGEQFGLVGCLVALGLFALLLMRATYLAISTEDLYAALLVTGLTSVLAVHVVFNVGMATGVLPVTGLPLPFFSYGGSFMLTCFIMIGLILSVSARRQA